METLRNDRNRDDTTKPQPEEAETILEEVIDVSLQPDRAHHDELGRTVNGDEEPASPREQAPAPLDVTKIDE